MKYISFKFLSAMVLMRLFSFCHSDVTIENKNSSVQETKTASISTEIEKNDKLAKWKVLEVNQEVIVIPPDWTVQANEHDLTIIPPNSLENKERFIFKRLTKDSPSLDYDQLGQQLATSAFKDFIVQQRDTLKKIEFQNNICYERNTALAKNNLNYIGYVLLYIDDNSIYEYNIVMSAERLNDYDGNLTKDIIGNLRIKNNYIISDENPVNKVHYIYEK